MLMYQFKDLILSGNKLVNSYPAVAIGVLPDDLRVVLSIGWVAIIFEQDETNPGSTMIMNIKVVSPNNEQPFSARVELDNCYGAEPCLVGNIAENVIMSTFNNVVKCHLTSSELNKLCNCIDALFTGIIHETNQPPKIN